MSAATQRYHCREIFAKAICGKGRKFSQSTHTVSPLTPPVHILGAWVINHKYKAVKSGDFVEIVGSYDLNVWYACEKNTKTEVANETVSYVDHVPLSFMDGNMKDNDVQVLVTPTLEPNCIDAYLSPNGTNFVIEVEREFLVEIIGETKLSVLVCASDEDFVDKDFDLDFMEEDLPNDLSDEEDEADLLL